MSFPVFFLRLPDYHMSDFLTGYLHQLQRSRSLLRGETSHLTERNSGQ